MKVLLASRFGFREQDIRTLENHEATADAILSAIQTHLIEPARPSDVSLFYYAGHGSRMRNLGTKEHSGYDSTIVAAARQNLSVREAQLAEHLAKIDRDMRALEHEQRLATRERLIERLDQARIGRQSSTRSRASALDRSFAVMSTIGITRS